MAKEHFISLTTIITLLVILVTEASHNLLASYRFKEMNILLGAAIGAFILFIITKETGIIKRKYHQIARLTIILLLALSVEAFANYVINTTGKWLGLSVALLLIYSLAWYGYVETKNLHAL